jgi:hypothetical protein
LKDERDLPPEIATVADTDTDGNGNGNGNGNGDCRCAEGRWRLQ